MVISSPGVTWNASSYARESMVVLVPMTPMRPVLDVSTARRAAGRITSTTGMPRRTVYRSRASGSATAVAELQAMTSIFTPSSTSRSITASAIARTAASGFGPYGLFAVSPR